MAKKDINNPALETWITLNDKLRDADEKLCQHLLGEELNGRRRQAFLRRIHSRLNKVRADKERKELGL